VRIVSFLNLDQRLFHYRYTTDLSFWVGVAALPYASCCAATQTKNLFGFEHPA
jgi:hypothetical protein